jgi:hydrogenase expression/formation protein HypE
MRSLVEEIFLPGFESDQEGVIGLSAMDDGAAIRLGDRWLVLTTDSHVVHPIFFPGGDIGRLAIAGTVNDLAVMGATRVLGLTCAAIIEEGLPKTILRRIQRSIREACAEAGTSIVTGDTKVMGRGELDGIILNTSGIGMCERVVSDAGLHPGDRIIVTGSLGDHGMAVMAVRHELELDGDLESDVMPINDLIDAALRVGGSGIVAMKDPTRGGVASALHEMATKSHVGIVIAEVCLPVRAAVRSASELLGIDPLRIANEGKALLGVRPDRAADVLDALRHHPKGRDAAIIGECFAERAGSVVLDTGFGRRLLTEADGEPLPRIC